MYKMPNGIYNGNAAYVYDLPICYRKSWYGKVKVIETEHEIALRSYDTVVCRWNKDDSTFVKLWDGYSATTMRHVNCFMDYIGLPYCGGKKWWDNFKPGKTYTVNDLVNLV